MIKVKVVIDFILEDVRGVGEKEPSGGTVTRKWKEKSEVFFFFLLSKIRVYNSGNY